MKVYLPGENFPNYQEALRALGAEPCSTDPDSCAGLLLPGGCDIHPRLYGQKIAGSRGIDEARDQREVEAFHRFLALGRPIFGICRGAQLINVLFGGTLLQDISGHRAVRKKDRLHASHTDDPLLCRIYGEKFVVNSSHHQAIDRLGDGLRAVQWADDGTVEAIRHTALPVFAVQWHPERLREPTDGWKLIAAWLETL